MRYLDTRTLQKMETRPRAARTRRFVWLVWVMPHLIDGPRHATKTNALRWPVYLQHGAAA